MNYNPVPSPTPYKARLIPWEIVVAITVVLGLGMGGLALGAQSGDDTPPTSPPAVEAPVEHDHPHPHTDEPTVEDRIYEAATEVCAENPGWTKAIIHDPPAQFNCVTGTITNIYD